MKLVNDGDGAKVDGYSKEYAPPEDIFEIHNALDNYAAAMYQVSLPEITIAINIHCNNPCV